MELKHSRYLGNPEALETYNRIVNSIIKENAEKLIHFEKIFLIYNENFLDIKQKIKYKLIYFNHIYFIFQIFHSFIFR